LRPLVDTALTITLTPPTCVECSRPWLDPDERWRSYLDHEDELRLFCPDCAEREFGAV
jgi:hypothetical protein